MPCRVCNPVDREHAPDVSRIGVTVEKDCPSD
jgi:hypothetical protein